MRKIVSGWLAANLTLLCVVAESRAQTLANWEEKKPASNSGFYVTTKEMPPGATVKIKIIKKGNAASITVCNYIGLNIISTTLKQWNSNALGEGQVLSYKLEKPTKVGVYVGGINFWLKPSGIVQNEGFHRMNFEGGWELDTKIEGESF